MNVFDHEIQPGCKQFFSVAAGSYANGAEIRLPVIVVCGAEPGATFWISGEVHGEELNGSIATWEFLRELDPRTLKGCIIATPAANPLALSDRNKISVIDYLDMDTAFPGTATGTWTQRIAGILFQELVKCADYVLSFHTLAPRHLARPYTVSKLVPGVDPQICLRARELALRFGVEANCSVDLSSARGELPGVMSGALDILCMQHGIPAFMAEMGCGSSREESSVQIARQGLLNVLSAVGMLSARPVTAEKQILITKRSFIRVNQGGLLVERRISPGDYIKAGTLLAQTHFFGESVTDYYAPADLYVIAARKHPVIHTGERIAFVGTEWSEVKPAENTGMNAR